MTKLAYLAMHGVEYEGTTVLSVHHTQVGAQARVEDYARITRDWMDLPERFTWEQVTETFSKITFDFGCDRYYVVAAEIQE